VAENPNRRGMLFAGTGHGFFYSLDDGASWTQLKRGLPAAPVSWIATQKLYHDVVISTYGRGLFILRDITTLEESDKAVAADNYLFAPKTAVREPASGNAEFIYKLKDAPATPVRFEILDAQGKVIRQMDSQARPGLNRAVWDLRYTGSRQVALRTTPPDNPHIWEEARFKGRDTRPIIHWGIQPAQTIGPIAAPGKYTVRMTANSQQFTQPLEVVKDPAIPTSDADVLANTEAQVRIVNDMNESVDIINRLEIVGKQIEDQLKANQAKSDIVKELTALEQKRMAVMLQLLTRTELHSDDKWYVEAYKIYLNLIWHYGEIAAGGGDVAGGAEFRPTNAAMKVLEMLESDLAKAKADFNTLMTKDLPAFNQKMSGKLAPIVEKPVM